MQNPREGKLRGIAQLGKERSSSGRGRRICYVFHRGLVPAQKLHCYSGIQCQSRVHCYARCRMSRIIVMSRRIVRRRAKAIDPGVCLYCMPYLAQGFNQCFFNQCFNHHTLVKIHRCVLPRRVLRVFLLASFFSHDNTDAHTRLVGKEINQKMQGALVKKELMSTLQQWQARRSTYYIL